MGRLKVTAKGKVKKNIPITRIGKKQYLKRRFAHIRAVDVAGANNSLTQKYIQSAGGKLTAEQGYTHLGLRMDASAPVSELKEKRSKMPTRMKSSAFEEEEENIHHQEAVRRENYIARPVDEQESSMIGALLHAYGTDLKRMTYDHKLNPFQLNARQLQRQIVNYLKWEKAAFPKAFAEAEQKGWFSVEMYQNPILRMGAHPKASASIITTEKKEEKESDSKGSKSSKNAKKKKEAKRG